MATKFSSEPPTRLGQRHRGVVARSARSCPCSSSSTLGVIVVSMNISEPPPLRSFQARCDTGSVCSSAELLVAQRAEHEVGRHQLGQRGRVGLARRRRARPAPGWLVRSSRMYWRAAISGGCGACAPTQAREAVTAASAAGKQSFHRIRASEVERSSASRCRERRTTSDLSSGSCPWKKCPAPGTTITGSACGRAQSSVGRQRHHVVGLAVDDQRVRRHGGQSEASGVAGPTSTSRSAAHLGQPRPRPATRHSRRRRSRPAPAAGPGSRMRGDHGQRVVDLAAALVPARPPRRRCRGN